MKKLLGALLALSAVITFGTSAIADDWNQNQGGYGNDRPSVSPKKKKRKSTKENRGKKKGRKKKTKNHEYRQGI